MNFIIANIWILNFDYKGYVSIKDFLKNVIWKNLHFDLNKNDHRAERLQTPELERRQSGLSAAQCLRIKSVSLLGYIILDTTMVSLPVKNSSFWFFNNYIWDERKI